MPHLTRSLLLALLVAGAILGARQARAATFAPHSVGYMGCSNSEFAVIGYHNLGGNMIWPAYYTGGGSIDQWANPASSFWASFTKMETSYKATTTAVWFQLCEDYPRQQNTYAQVQQALANLQGNAPGVTAYISAINPYNPVTLCSDMGPQGQGIADTQAWAQQAVTDGLAQAGPSMATLDSTTTQADHCHPNAVGQAALGQSLSGFFDSITTPITMPTTTPTATTTPTDTPTVAPCFPSPQGFVQ